MTRVKLKPRERQFVIAYLGEANGNATKAAVLAGYSAKTARQAGSRLLTRVDIRSAIDRKAERTDVTAERAIENLGRIANHEPTKVGAADVIQANKLILQAKGALQAKPRESGITVNIGFIQQPTGEPTVIDVTPKPTLVMGPVVASQPLVSAASRENDQ